MYDRFGIFVGGVGLFYDLYKEKGSSLKNIFAKDSNKFLKEEGVKTITPTTTIGKWGLKFAKMALGASSPSGVACGLAEGIPMMALGEAMNMGVSSILETPIGTGLFGIGIASVFLGLALDNTPELKLNQFKFMAEEKTSKKAKLIVKNMLKTSKEIGASVFEIAKNIFNKGLQER